MRKTRRLILLGLAVCLVAGVTYAASRVGPRWFPQYFRSVWGALGEPLATDVPPGLADLPVVMVDGHDPHGPLAVVLSGNGGWWGITDSLAKTFAKAGITTIGLNSLAYFIDRRSPEETAAVIERMVATFPADRPLLLVGYSYGADVIATVYARLSPATRARVRLVSLIGLSHIVDYAIGFWKVAAPHYATVQAVAAIEGPRIQCLQGSDEGKRSACGQLDPAHVEIITLPGGHHFDGDYAKMAQRVLQGLGQVEARP
ncbi:AcvB/VirJ family lysyl-phosphatidylglycerol hydrolase [Labrys wisconsinensis]|uniref:Type IV secretory pathway VirJ component n=1 Tax=Labrys wisconsinensis TaxID=425677 RepID=A0ABU0JHN0_9HYPH|nr:AcvB/VirJ family lysyl-phosphatidylglycerol hydrolase [Labrys wisconsinensis]MDQ0473801.1 type IV secretory pathway VirJ component [Labrys wisconsinensis]